MRARMVVSEAFRSLTANLSTTLAATMTVLIGMFLLGVFIALGTWVLNLSESAKRELVVKTYFCTTLECGRDATGAQINAARQFIDAMPEVPPEGIRFISRAEALRIMEKRTPEIVENLTSNPLPASFEIRPARAEDVSVVAQRIETAKLAGVQEVDYGKKLADRVLDVARLIWVVFLVAVVLLVVASTLLIANTIRLSIFARRREIEVMKLVGATNWFVRGPFMLEGLMCGLLGAVAAVVLLLLGKEAIAGTLDDRNWTRDAEAISFTVNALILVLAGLVLGAAGSGLTLRRFLRV